MNFVGEAAAEVDRLVVAIYERTQTLFAASEFARSLKAHPGLLNGLALLDGPIEAESVTVIYPYLPDRLRGLLVQNNIDEGVIRLEGDRIVLTDAGVAPAHALAAMFEQAAESMWTNASDLSEVEPLLGAAVGQARALPAPILPSAFALAEQLTDRPTQPERVFRHVNALRYWRADAHRAAWSAAGLTVQEAHALNRLWDVHRHVERVGQGEPRPGRTGVAGLTERGYAAGEAITSAGVTVREAIEADTDARTAPIYEPLDEPSRVAFLNGLRELPIN